MNRRNIGRSRQQFYNCVQHTLNTFVFKCGTAQHRLNFACQSTLTQCAYDFFLGQLIAAQVFVHQFFAGFSCGFNHVLTPFFSSFNQFSGNVAIGKGCTFIGFIPDDGFHFQQVNNTGETVFCAYRNDDRYWVCAQTGFHLLDNAEKVSTLTVHFIYKRQAWHLVFVGLTPYGFRLRLNTTHRAVNHYRTIQYTHRTLYLYGKVNVSRSVDNVEAVFWELFRHTGPVGSNGSGGNGNTTLLLLFHVVGSSRAIMYLAQFVGQTGIEQNTFCSSGFTRVNMGGNTDVAVQADRGLTSHFISLSKLETEVRECFVGFSHAMYFFTFFQRTAAAFGRINQLACQTQVHGFLTTFAGRIANPAHCKSQTA